jgi:hypothetical protein
MAITKIMVSVPDEVEVNSKRKRPGDDPLIRRAVTIQDSISRLSPGTGENSVDDLRQWRDSHLAAPSSNPLIT